MIYLIFQLGPTQLIRIHNRGRGDFFVNNAQIVSVNVCLSSMIKCHGVDAIIEYNRNGKYITIHIIHKSRISLLQVQATLNIRKDFICPGTCSKLYPTDIKPLLRFKLFVFTCLDIFSVCTFNYKNCHFILNLFSFISNIQIGNSENSFFNLFFTVQILKIGNVKNNLTIL